MRCLLVPFDDSEPARRALRYAIDLARESNHFELRIVNAHEPPIVSGEVSIYLSEEKAQELQRQHSEDVLRLAIELAQTSGVKFTSEILIGKVPEVIVSHAEEKGCDGIVMGTRGMSAIGNLLMGSVATKVVHLTKLPVTLIK